MVGSFRTGKSATRRLSCCRVRESVACCGALGAGGGGCRGGAMGADVPLVMGGRFNVAVLAGAFSKAGCV